MELYVYPDMEIYDSDEGVPSWKSDDYYTISSKTTMEDLTRFTPEEARIIISAYLGIDLPTN